MGKIAQQFADLKKSTPKHIQWILMIAAFVVVVVLIVLLSGKKKTPDIQVIGTGDDTIPQIQFDPKNASFDWEKTKVGETQTADIDVSANTAVRITDVKVNLAKGDEKSAGISAVETCTNEQIVVSDEVSCTITIKYEPTATLEKTDATVTVTWHPLLDETIEKTENAATIVIAATADKKDAAPVVETQEVVPIVPEEDEDAEEEDEEEVPEEDTTAAQDLQKDLDDIAPAMEIIETPKPTSVAPQTKKEKKISLGVGCSDFSFPAYNLSGVQNGWIKPEGGAYYFYKLDDEKCENRAGVYNAETGFVMDIANKSKKIGSDAEHIRVSLQVNML